MKKVLIGHRGVGKSAFLQRHAVYYPQVPHFDLDQEIENYLQHSIQDFFLNQSESEFRQIEQDVFRKLTTENPEYVIALGGGFNIGSLPSEIEKLLISRRTDIDGRIFLNRPRLEPELSQLDEYKIRYNSRDKIFLKSADSIYDLPEGLTLPDKIERRIVAGEFIVTNAFYTLSLQDLSRLEERLKNFKNIELRTDLLADEIIYKLLTAYPGHRWLISIRSGSGSRFLEAAFRDVDIGFYCQGCQIVSSHANDIDTGITQLSGVSERVHLKLSPVVESFEDLKKGYEWQQADSENRSFLPRSASGKWIWFRQLSKYFQKLNFLRNFTKAPDQPSLTEWLDLPSARPSAWAALLGSPIHHSHSPAIHKDYFVERGSFFGRIAMNNADLETGLKFSIGLGLKYAAVTSPLKKSVWQLADFKSEIADRFESANTLYVSNDGITCDNTDLVGFSGLVKNFPAGTKVAVWGGGGTLKLMQSVLPAAYFYSSRTGQLRNERSADSSTYDYLIWAAPRRDEPVWPADELTIKTVVDLNYSENSPGLEFAARRNIRYINGLEMLVLQAEKQQEFWSWCECK